MFTICQFQRGCPTSGTVVSPSNRETTVPEEEGHPKNEKLLNRLWIVGNSGVHRPRRVNVSREKLTLRLERPMTVFLSISKCVENKHGFLNILFLDDHVQLPS